MKPSTLGPCRAGAGWAEQELGGHNTKKRQTETQRGGYVSTLLLVISSDLIEQRKRILPCRKIFN